jgi:hypothetical protein
VGYSAEEIEQLEAVGAIIPPTQRSTGGP